VEGERGGVRATGENSDDEEYLSEEGYSRPPSTIRKRGEDWYLVGEENSEERTQKAPRPPSKVRDCGDSESGQESDSYHYGEGEEVSKEVKRDIRASDLLGELSAIEIKLLFTLYERRYIAINSLFKAAGCGGYRNIAKLEHMGLVRIESSRYLGKIRLVSLTERGEKLVKVLMLAFKEGGLV